ncbi:MAG: hypothetical protein MJ237_05060, partial [bacterium]|nr:hypothetical protein [bacterium]
RVMIDVNGKERPNMYGRDVFAFTMDRDGSLIPFGTMGRWRNSSSNNDERCILTNSNNFSGSGLGCTARLMGNNYKMDY